MYHRLPGRNAPRAIRQAMRWVTENPADSLQIGHEDKKLQKVLKIDKEILCKRQMGN